MLHGFDRQRIDQVGLLAPKQQQPDQTRYRSQFEGHPSKAPASTCGEDSAYDHPGLELGDQRHAPLLAHGVALGRRQAVDRALDIEQGIDAPRAFLRAADSTSASSNTLRRLWA